MLYGTWLETYRILYLMNKKPNTRECYMRSIRAMPEEIKQTELVSSELLVLLRQWQTERAKTAPRAAQLDRILIVQSLRMAAAYGHTAQREWSLIFPAILHRSRETAYLSKQDLLTYIQTAMQRAQPATPALLFMAGLGLRRGEALGVRWIDIQGNILHIMGQRIKNSYTDPKSEAGRREIMMPEWLSRELDSYRTESEYVSPVSSGQLYREHYAVISAAGLPRVTPHGLRHSLAMACIDEMSIKALQRLLGHSKMSLTADLYGGHHQTASLPSGVCNVERVTRLEIV